MDLEEATIEQIADEIRRRTTFRGILAWQPDYAEGKENDQWKWVANNCSPATITRNLGEQLPE